MWQAFQDEYFPTIPTFRLKSHELRTSATESGNRTNVDATVEHNGVVVMVKGEGAGPVEAFVRALRTEFIDSFDVVDYTEHAIGSGANARAVAYVESSTEIGDPRWGIGVDENITTASLLAVLGALDRHRHSRPVQSS
jgi:2-isopropylmalate synthase